MQVPPWLHTLCPLNGVCGARGRAVDAVGASPWPPNPVKAVDVRCRKNAAMDFYLGMQYPVFHLDPSGHSKPCTSRCYIQSYCTWGYNDCAKCTFSTNACTYKTEHSCGVFYVLCFSTFLKHKISKSSDYTRWN